MNNIVLDGTIIKNESEFHRVISDVLGFGPFYGRNMNALWDRLSTDIERPIKIIWLHSDVSKKFLGDSFDRIVRVFESTREQDITLNLDARFDYILY